MKLLKRILSATLCLALALCLVPATAKAVNPEHHLILADDFTTTGSWGSRSKVGVGGEDAVFGSTILDGMKTGTQT